MCPTQNKAASIATPEGDVIAWRTQRQPGAAPALTPDLLELAQSGAAILLASCTAGGRPVTGTAICCRALAGDRLRIIASEGANRPLVAALHGGGRIAVTFTGSNQHHRAFQVKAGTARLGPVCSDDTPEIERQGLLFCDGLMEIGFTRDLAAGWLAQDPGDLLAIEVTPERVFTQTPGPGAGAELTP